MTPQERELVADLFERLSELEREPRDPDAERTIREGLSRAPNALYALVQTVLLQDEALKAADDHIQELEQELQRGAPQGGGERSRGFLDSMRDSFFGRGDEPRGSVPPSGGRPMGVPPGYGGGGGGGYGSPWGGGGQGGPMGGAPMGGAPMAGGPMGEPPRGGGGFLGTAAAAAAGMIGGGLLMNGIRSAMAGAGGGQAGGGKGPFAGAFDQLAGGGGRGGSPWESGGSNPLSKEAGLDDIGSSRRAGMADMRNQSNDESDDDVNDADYDDDDSDSDDDDTIET